MKVKLCGTVTYDCILQSNSKLEWRSNRCHTHRIQAGGLVNTARILRKLDPSLEITIHSNCIVNTAFDPQSIVADEILDLEASIGGTQSFGPISVATILQGKDSKISGFSLGKDCIIDSNDLVDKDTNWYHFSYLDILKSADGDDFLIPNIDTAIVSVDLVTPGKDVLPSVYKSLPNIDYLIVSDSEIDITDKTLHQKIVSSLKKALIIHAKHKTIFIGKDSQFTHIHHSEVLGDRDIVGAGDAFVAGYITHTNIPQATKVAFNYCRDF
jgi:hypothetical protein